MPKFLLGLHMVALSKIILEMNMREDLKQDIYCERPYDMVQYSFLFDSLTNENQKVVILLQTKIMLTQLYLY